MKTNTREQEQLAHPKVDAMAVSAHEAVDWAASATNDATDSLKDTGRDMKAMQTRWSASGRKYLQDNPGTSVGIALAAGYLLSRILRSR